MSEGCTRALPHRVVIEQLRSGANRDVLTEKPVKQVLEVVRHGGVGCEVVPLALNDVRREVRWGRRVQTRRKEADVPEKQAANRRIVVGLQGGQARSQGSVLGR